MKNKVTLVVISFAAIIGIHLIDQGEFSGKEQSDFTQKEDVSSRVDSQLGSKQTKEINEQTTSSEPSTISKNKAYYLENKPLEPKEEKLFLQEMSQVFLDDRYSIVDQDVVLDKIVKLNEKYRRGVVSSLNSLKNPATSRDEALQHVAIIDYLSYRLQFDQNIGNEIVELISSPISQDLSIKQLASTLADRIELIESLSNTNWEQALSAIESIKSEDLSKRLSKAAYQARVSEGADKVSVASDLKSVSDWFQAP